MCIRSKIPDHCRHKTGKTLVTLRDKKVLGASSDLQGLLQEAPGQSPCLIELPLWALVGWGRQVGAWGAGLGPMGYCWSAVVCSPADAANQIDLVMHKSCNSTHESSGPE